MGRHFVLTLLDYYTEKARITETQASVAVTKSYTASVAPMPSEASSDVPISAVALKPEFAVNRAKAPLEDPWALSCINILQVQPILEAFDDNGTGYNYILLCIIDMLTTPNRFVSITEANNVCLHPGCLSVIPDAIKCSFRLPDRKIGHWKGNHLLFFFSQIVTE
jgi:hypothetical protein